MSYGAQPASTAASWSTAWSISSSVITSGGASRIVEPWVSLASTPRAAQPLAGLPAGHQRRVDVDAGPQAAAAHRDDALADQRRPGRRAGARPSSAERALVLAGGQQPDDRAADRAGQRVAAERRAVLARACSTPSTSRSATTAETGTMPPPSALPSRYTSGTTPSWSQAKVSPVRPRPDWISSAMNSTLRSVHSSPDARPGSRPAGRARRPRPGSARAARRRCSSSIAASQRVQVAVRARSGSPGVYGPKSSRASGSVGEADDRGGPAVEVAARRRRSCAWLVRHALDLVAPLAGDLDRGLDRLGAGVHRQHHVLAGTARPARRQNGAELVVVERPAGQRDPVELRAGGGDQRRVPVAEVQRRVAGEAVQVAPAVDVGHPGALGVGDDDRQRVVVVRGPALGVADRAPASAAVVAITGSPFPDGARSVQHFGPPPALRSSDRSTGIGLVAAVAQLRGQAGGLRGQHDVAAVADRVEAEHRGVGRGGDAPRRGTAGAAPPGCPARTPPGRYATVRSSSTVSAVSRW